MVTDGTGDETPLPLQLVEGGESSFVDAIREVNDASALGDFANTWYDDRRPSSRRLLLEYLDRPLNAFRHEALIKRLFKRAEAENDDEMMARFLVLFDRSVRRVRGNRRSYHYRECATEDEAREVATLWERLGYLYVRTWENTWQKPSRYHVHGQQTNEVIVPPRKTTMPRGTMIKVSLWGPSRTVLVPDWAILFKLDWEGSVNKADIRARPVLLEKLKKLRLFSVATRNYLRRRAWRYFRKLGKAHPERYLAAVSEALTLYRDEDVADGLALIDNWGLVHILFHHSSAIEAKPGGWSIKPDHSLAELAPAPIFDDLWSKSPQAVVGLLEKARSQTVRRWALRRIASDFPTHRAALSLEGWIGLLGHDDPEVVGLAAEMLDGMEGLDSMGVDRWLMLAESTHPIALEAVCELIKRHVRPDQVTLEQATRLAGLRALPVARLGLSWLRMKPLPTSSDLRTVLSLVEAGCEPLRAEILSWLRGVLASSPEFDPSMVLEFLDSRHIDVRREGWAWFQAEPRSRNDIEIWRKLLESPYDDVRLALVAELESRAVEDSGKVSKKLEPEDLRRLWASVLLNVHRGSKSKPDVVRQLLRRLETSPGDASVLLPLLSVALRSSRGPERKAGLVAVVQLVEKRAEVEPLVRSSFPELQFT